MAVICDKIPPARGRQQNGYDSDIVSQNGEIGKKNETSIIPFIYTLQIIMESILLDAQFQELSTRDRRRILDRLLSEIRYDESQVR